MITATFSNSNDYCIGFEISGHSGMSYSGNDILCAAVSGATELAANIINGLTTVDESKAIVSVNIPHPDITSEAVVTALKNQFLDYSKEYPKNIRIVEQECK